VASRKQTHRLDKGSGKRQSPKPAIRDLEPLAPQRTYPATLVQRAKHDARLLTPGDVLQLQRTTGNQAVGQLLAQTGQRQPDQEEQNKPGLPDNLKTGVENLSGYAMDDVQVDYNSSKPAQLQALAYTQGTGIHVAPGQEKRLGHEAWHVVQQKQGRVKPTIQMKGTAINDDKALEKEADAMATKSLQASNQPSTLAQLKSGSEYVTQRLPSRDTIQMDEKPGMLTKVRRLFGIWSKPDAPAPFTPGGIEFATLSGGKVGSIYFENARIRLIHGKGPHITKRPLITRFTMSTAHKNRWTKWKKLKDRSRRAKYRKAMKYSSCKPAVVNQGDKLIEFFGDKGADGNHPSRGGPRTFAYDLTKKQLNMIYNAASTGDNTKLKEVMDSNQALSKIPMNPI